LPAQRSQTSNGDRPFAKELFEAADRMRGSVESAEYKHLELSLLFLCSSTASRTPRRAQLETWTVPWSRASRRFGDDPDATRDVLGRTYEYFIEPS